MPIPYVYPTSFPYGSRVVTFSFSGGGSASVILEAFEPSEGTFEINRQNELGAPNGFVLIAEPRTATATAQLATTSTTYISRGDFSQISIKNGTSITFVVTQVSQPEGNREVKRQTLSLREEI
jgi:hypothetical protein